MLVFNGLTVGEVVAAFNRCRQTPILVEVSRSLRCPLTTLIVESS